MRATESPGKACQPERSEGTRPEAGRAGCDKRPVWLEPSD